MTTDGSISDIPRESYVSAEERVVAELKEVGKPFILIVNSIHPEREETKRLANELAEKYDIPALALSVADMREEDMLDACAKSSMNSRYMKLT